MQVEFENSALQEAIRVIQRLAVPVSGAVTVETDGKKCWLRSTSDMSRASINLPAQVEGKANKFNVNLTSLKDATKGRETLTMIYSKTMCKLKAKSYALDLATEDAMEMDYDKEEMEATMEITAEQSQWLKQALATVNLKPTLLLSPFMPVCIKMTKKGAFICCYDDAHMAYIRSSEIKGDMEITLPIDMLTSVIDAFSAGAFKLSLSKANVYVSNKLMQVVISRPEDQENALTVSDIIEGAKATKADGTSVSVPKAQLLTFMDNIRAVATKERAEIEIDVDGSTMTLKVATGSGSAKAVMKVEANAKVKVSIDYEYMDEAVRKSGDQTMFKIVDGAMAAFSLKQGTVVVGLNQEKE